MNTGTRAFPPESPARCFGRALVAALALLAVVPVWTGGAPADLDEAAEAWLARMSLLLLPEERTLFRELGSATDREEFQRIFWARRDPDPTTPVNELQQAVGQVEKRADELYSVPGRRGSETGCGKVLALLGEPRERAGREARALFDNDAYVRQGALAPETWIYRDRPGYPISFTGGELSIAFDSNCEFAEGGRVLEELRRVAASLVVRPEIEYRRSAAGGLVPLEEILPAPSGGALLV
jgi:GWxTD domain-containing protein